MSADPASSSLVTVIIPAFNAADTIGDQLEALTRQTYAGPWEVIVSDNGSTDGTPSVAESFKGRVPGLRVVDASARRGVSHARNAGAAAARGDVLLFCDADDVVVDEWVETMQRALSAHEVVGGCLDCTKLNSPNTLRNHHDHDASGRAAPLGMLPYAVGATCGVRTSVFNSLSGWNETYVNGADDEDFSWRAQLASHRLGFASEAVVAYRHRSTLRGHVRQHFGYGAAQALLYRDYGCHGMRRRSPGTVLRGWAWILLNATDLRDRDKGWEWWRAVALQAGRIRGSFRYRVLFL